MKFVIECPKGTYGENCSEICPVNLYGELCLERCDCKPNEDCNRVHGCLPSIIVYVIKICLKKYWLNNIYNIAIIWWKQAHLRWSNEDKKVIPSYDVFDNTAYFILTLLVLILLPFKQLYEVEQNGAKFVK